MASNVRGLCTACRIRLRPAHPTAIQAVALTHPFSSSSRRTQDLETSSPSQPPFDPAIIAGASSTPPPNKPRARIAPPKIRGPLRRRRAIASTRNIPFEQLPYQCFQEARKVLSEDREEKIQEIVTQRARISRLKDADPAASGGQARKAIRLTSMQMRLEELKILADINDPMIKKRFEDDLGDMNRPIYRHYARQKWLARPYKITMQRITQMSVMPDYLPKIEPTISVVHSFGRLRRQKVEPGSFVPTYLTLHAPKLAVQCFDKGEKLVTVAIVDGDVPDFDSDAFRQRLHFLACNITISPTETFIGLEETIPQTAGTKELLRETASDLPDAARSHPPPIPRAYLSSETQLVHPYLPPWSSKGAPYHRMTIFILQQPDNKPLDTSQVLSKTLDRDNFTLRSLVDRHKLNCIGVDMFRTRFDDTTDWAMTKIRDQINRMQQVDALLASSNKKDSAQSQANVKEGDVKSEVDAKARVHPPSASRRANDAQILEQLEGDAAREFKHKKVEPLPLRKKPSSNERFR